MELTRIYGKSKEIAPGYFELAYREYREDGTLHQTGTEDFSLDRLRTLNWVSIHTWDGKRRNKGGYRWWEHQRDVRCSNVRNIKPLAMRWYPEAAEIEVRKFF